jgi:hypothetical protein
MKIRLRKSKTDQDGLGRIIEMSNESKIYLINWLEQSKITSGDLFRGIKNNNKMTISLNKSRINKIFKELAGKINIKKEIVAKISGHSTRVGAAQDLLILGASFPVITQKGRWTKTDTVIKYISEVKNFNKFIL